MSKQDIEKRLGFAAQGVKVEMASGWSGKSAKLNRYGNFAVVAAGEDGYAKGFANRTQAQAFSDKHNLGGVKFPSSGGRSFYVFMEAPKDSESTTAARPGVKAKFDREVGRKGNKSAMIAKNGPDADASWLAWVVQHHGEGQGESVLGTMRSYSTEARAKAAALRGLETSGLRGGFSRPGVKAEFIRFMDLETWKNSKGTVFTAGIEEDSGNRFTPYVTSRDSSGGLQLRTLSAPTFKTEKGARKWLNTWMQSNKSTSSRPGVKAKMGLEMNMLDFRHKFFTAFGTAIRDAKSNPNTAEAQSDETVLRESWASMFAQGYSDAISDLNGLSATMKSKTSVGQMRKAASDAMETYRQAKAAVRSSRPGSKAKA